MRFLFRLLIAVLLAAGARAADTVKIAPPPAWVVVRAIDPLPATPPADASYGYDYLILDHQVMVSEQATYTHNVYRVTSEGSLQSASRLALNFDPAYEAVTLHHVRVIRDGRAEDRLAGTPVKIIQQERDLDRHLLNGELTALMVLEDIRVGDVIDYAYTRRGWNPVFDGRYFAWVDTGWPVPVRWRNYRLVMPAGRVPNIQPRGPQGRPPVLLNWVDRETLTLTQTDVTPIAGEKETPGWWESYPSIQISEFKDWSEVVNWAEPLFALPDVLPDTVQVEAARLTAGVSGEEAKAMALLRFVQQEIRYLGMELGTGSYRPSPPAVVLARRFGDCKDKVLLFCALARAAGLEARPAFVNTAYLDHVEDWLPTPQAFDHVIAMIPGPAGTERFVDPTLSYQQGGFATRGLPDYRRALVVRPGGGRFSTVGVPPQARAVTRVEERIESSAFDRPAEFHVRTIMTGLAADDARAEFAGNTLAEIGKSYLNYYAAMMPGITATKPPHLTDDPADNRVTIEESYAVPDLWKKNETGRWAAEFTPKLVLDRATRPGTTIRTTPLAVAYPGKIELTTTVHLPEEWRITPDKQTMESDGFRGTVSSSGQGREIVLRYSWESLADHVQPDRVAAHVAALTKFRDALGYSLTYKPASVRQAAPVTQAPAFRINWLIVLVALVVLAAGIWVICRVHGRAAQMPPLLLEPGSARLTGLGGWLILVAIGLVVTPLRLLFLVGWTQRHIFSQDVWEAVTLPGGAAYQEWLGPLIINEVAGNLAVLVLGCWALVLFFRRHRFFPRVFITMSVLGLVLVVCDAVAAHYLITGTDNTGDTWMEIGRSLMQVCVWVPYMLLSKRVKYTFTR